MGEVTVRKNYFSLDIAKFVCAIMILSAHFASERGHFTGIVDYLFSLYIFAVPFFFACSGFLFFEKLKNISGDEAKHSYFVQYEKRIWIMYLIWSVIYWAFRIVKFAMYGVASNEIIRLIHMSITYQTYGTIWFLPALAVAIAIVYMLRNMKLCKLCLIAAVLYVIGCLGYSYIEIGEKIPVIDDILKINSRIFFTTRNGLFNGVPCVTVGYFISQKRNNLKLSVNAVFAIIFSGLTVIEALACKLYISKSASGADTLIMMIPAIYFILSALLQIQIREKFIYIYMRKLSLLVFTTQRLFLSAIPAIWPEFMMPFTYNTYLGLFMMVALVIVFSLLLIKLSIKVKFIKYII